MDQPQGPEEALTTTGFAPKVDIYEDEHNFTLKIEVPGVEGKDIDVRIKNNTLVVHGERSLRKKRKKRTTVASSGSTEASPARSRYPTPWIQGR
jgi:HSP20 family molecular chaperone IbpA